MLVSANIGAVIYCLSTKVGISLPAAGTYILGVVAIAYQAFIIFSDLPLAVIVVGAILSVLVGVYLIYNTANTVAGPTYSLLVGQHAAGSVIVWIEYALIPLRLVTALGRAFKRPL